MYGYVYSVLRCPDCGADLMARDSINLELIVADQHISAKSRLIPFEGCGVLADADGEVAAGHHSQTLCEECGSSLVDFEEQITYETEEERGKAVWQAVEAIADF